jgi:YidC/Oxa1 family membrane protein insertase
MPNILYTIIIYPIVQIIEFVFVFAQKLFKETGFSIICVSGAVSILCLPLYMVAESWQEVERNIQQKLASKIAKIKAAFTGDERYMILSTYYRQNHYHPVYAMRGTFGLLIQIPFFIAAYSYLSHLDVLKGASFLFISDLGKPDALLPIAGGVNLLPILMTVINCAAGAIYTRGFAIKDKVQLYGMALIFLLLLYNSPSGLVLYWTLNNVFSFAKNIYLKINVKNKHYFLFSAISLFAFLLSFCTVLVYHGDSTIRILIFVLPIIIGILPWVIPFLMRIIQRVINSSSWTGKETLILFASSVLVIWVSTGVFIPSMLIVSSPQEFSFIDTVSSPLLFIYNSLFQALGLLVFWPFLIFLLFSENVKKLFSIIAAVISLSAICNLFVFPGNYGQLTGDMVFTESVDHSTKEIYVNFLVLALIFCLILFIYTRKNKKIFSFVNIILFLALFPFSVKNIYSINNEYNKLSEYYIPEQKTDETIEPIFSLSKTGKNVIVIMLDMSHSIFMPFIFDENPALHQNFDGFVYYPNTVTFNGWTKGGAPPIFGGYEYTPEGLNNRPDISLAKKNNEALLLMPKLFSESEFSVTITDPPYADDNWIPDLRIYDNENNIKGYITDGVYTDLWLKRNNIILPLHSEVLKRNILWYAIHREIPLVFREAIYNYGQWCAPFSGHRMRTFLNGYSVLDFLPDLTEIYDSNKDSALLMVNNTTHENLFLQAPLYKPQLSVTDYGNGRFSKEAWYHSNAAAMNRLSDFFVFLKNNDVYDNTRIILVSDHARLETSFLFKTSLPFHVEQFNPILFFKDFNTNGDMKTDMTFMSNADVVSIAINGIIDNPANPFTGNAISTGRKDDPLLILVQRVQNKNENEVVLNSKNTYYVHENIFDERNWTRGEAR